MTEIKPLDEDQLHEIGEDASTSCYGLWSNYTVLCLLATIDHLKAERDKWERMSWLALEQKQGFQMERDEARADNAALREALEKTTGAVQWVDDSLERKPRPGIRETRSITQPAFWAGHDAIVLPHPGAPVLKALEAAEALIKTFDTHPGWLAHRNVALALETIREALKAVRG